MMSKSLAADLDLGVCAGCQQVQQHWHCFGRLQLSAQVLELRQAAQQVQHT